jgi:acyl carrier protein
MNTTFARIAEILRSHFGVAPDKIICASTLDTLELESIDQICFGHVIEEVFAVDLDDTTFAHACTIGELVFAIEKYQALVAHERAA